MYKEILSTIDHIAIWPVISFVIFFSFFLVLVWWAFTVDHGFIRTMSHLPLEDGTDSTQPDNSPQP